MNTAPFSRLVSANEVPAAGRAVTLKAEPAELEALATLLKLPKVKRLEARLDLKPFAGGGLAVTGEVEAEVTQVCVVTLEEFDAEVREEIDARYVPDEGPRRDEVPGAEHEADLDAPDPLVNGRADLGALAAEHFALGLDPYPRKPDARLDEIAEEEPEDQTHRPFAGLDKLMSTPPAGKR